MACAKTGQTSTTSASPPRTSAGRLLGTDRVTAWTLRSTTTTIALAAAQPLQLSVWKWLRNVGWSSPDLGDLDDLRVERPRPAPWAPPSARCRSLRRGVRGV